MAEKAQAAGQVNRADENASGEGSCMSGHRVLLCDTVSQNLAWFDEVIRMSRYEQPVVAVQPTSQDRLLILQREVVRPLVFA